MDGLQFYVFSVGEIQQIVEMSGRLIAYLAVLESERPSCISGGAPVFMMQATDVREGNDSTLVR